MIVDVWLIFVFLLKKKIFVIVEICDLVSLEFVDNELFNWLILKIDVLILMLVIIWVLKFLISN